MITGVAPWEVLRPRRSKKLLRPRRSKKLPRHFVMVLTPDRAIAFKAMGGRPESGGSYELRIRESVKASFPRTPTS